MPDKRTLRLSAPFGQTLRLTAVLLLLLAAGELEKVLRQGLCWRIGIEGPAPLVRRISAPFGIKGCLPHWLQQRHQDEAAIRRWSRPAQAALLAVAILLMWIVTAGDPAPPFVYQGF